MLLQKIIKYWILTVSAQRKIESHFSCVGTLQKAHNYVYFNITLFKVKNRGNSRHIVNLCFAYQAHGIFIKLRSCRCF